MIPSEVLPFNPSGHCSVLGRADAAHNLGECAGRGQGACRRFYWICASAVAAAQKASPFRTWAANDLKSLALLEAHAVEGPENIDTPIETISAGAAIHFIRLNLTTVPPLRT
jgi:hypothetical protein